ncbi:MAG: EAL domain-containing protein [Burkholderiaceae bacterium]|nr:EAL domain-containing protein [Burkholderiaceae bacterium]
MSAKRITASFLAFGIGWILLSDWILELMVADAAGRSSIQSAKGIVFVLLSAALVYALVRAREVTQARLERETEHERDRIAHILEVSPAVIYTLAPPPGAPASADHWSWRVDFLGPNVAALTGFTADEWRSTPNLWHSRIHPDDLPEVMATQRRLQEEGHVGHEYRFLQANGSIRWLHDDVVLVRDAYQQPCQLIGAWLDVTDRKLAELATLEAERRFRRLYDANPLPMWVVDASTQRFVSVNQAALRAYGHTEADFLDLTLTDLAPDHPSGVALPAARQQQRHRHRDGSPFWVELVSHPVELDGRACHLLLAQDISDRLQAQAHERLIAKVFDASQEGIFITDARGHFESVNASFTRITGYDMDSLHGQTPALLKSGRHDESFYRHLWHALATDRRWEGEIWNARRSGEVYPAWLSISAIADEQQSVVQYLGIFTETSSRKDAEARIQRLVNYDNLTNLPNRALLNDRARVALAAAAQSQSPVAVMQLNVDHFKNINELFGHDAGDAVLVALAQRLQAELKHSDTVSRLGGDNFILLLPDTSALEAGKIALRLVAALGQPLMVGEQPVRITASMGVAVFPDNGTQWTQLTQAAETAVNQAKREGRNGVSFFSSSVFEELQHTLAVGQDLQYAVERQQLVLHYQPQVHATTGQVVGVEALVRWQHPEWGLVPPVRFIGVAEKAGLIRGIGDWVLQQALADSAQWQATGLPAVPVAVNLSMAQFRDAQLLDKVRQALAHAGVKPGMLELELTESIAMEDSEFTIATIGALKQLGVLLSIDDFGTGYSSLSYLKRFAVDKLKVDKSFVDGLGQHTDDEAIAIAVIQLARSLGLKTIAEGVETEAQAAFLRSHGCDEFQGYLFSRPLPAAELATWLASWRPTSQGATTPVTTRPA